MAQTQTYLCTVSRLRVLGVRQLGPFLRASAEAAAAARSTPGNVRTRLLGLPPFLTFQTLTVWESREAMQEFLRSAEHRVAMAGMARWARRGRFTTFETPTPRVGWLRGFRMLREPDALWTPEGTTRREEASLAAR
ncbi:MAG TPA: antibiotic biosynthesis monooxygenase [Candidatus Dormibacteraeota bacterium]|jgi:heme-degrading monooxygenase HmoA|nr:antibiotic biosynthesis monooxygenase [Candidatus Dormibacteraeota bacterium]